MVNRRPRLSRGAGASYPSAVLLSTYFTASVLYTEPLDKQRRTRRYIKYNSYFYSSTATIVCSRDTLKESSHIFFFCGGDSFCEVVRGPENTHEEWPAGLSLHLRDQRTSFLRLSDQWISAFSPELQTLYCLFKPHAEVWTLSLPHVLVGYWTYMHAFFFSSNSYQ